ncbi:MAG: ABC transporter permease [Defluviitaleaceae bacterium]|nr:ABC transporter permease [Defluviitaleaceae bacterium]
MSYEHLLYVKKLKKRNNLIKLTQVAILLSFFILWEVSSNMRWIDPFIFSSPSRLFNTLVNMVRNRTIFGHVGTTMGTTIAGFLISTILGVLISILLWFSEFLRKALNPYLVVLNSLPKTALAPIIIVWFGNTVRSVVVTAVLTSIIVTIISVLTGFLEIAPQKIKLIKSFGGTKAQILTKVILPASVPTIISALKINIGLSLVGVMVGEFLVASRGLGFLIIYGSQIFRMDLVMLSIMILCLLAAAMYKLIIMLEKKFVP